MVILKLLSSLVCEEQSNIGTTLIPLKLKKRKLSKSVRLCADLAQVLAPLRPCFKNFSNAKPWQRNEFHYQNGYKKKRVKLQCTVVVLSWL